MRIGLVAQEFPPETAKGGIGTQTRLKVQGLTGLGHDVRVISRAAEGPRSETARDGYRVIRVPSGAFPAATAIGDWLSHGINVAAEIARQHAADPFDILDFPEWACEGFVHLVNQTDWNRIPSVIQLHGPLALFVETMDWPEPGSEFRRLGTEMEAACLRLADAVYASSAYSRGIAARAYDLDPNAVPVLHSGIDLSGFAETAPPRPGGSRVLFVGKLVESKGVVTLAEAVLAAALRVPGLTVELIGGGERQVIDRLNAMAEAHGAADLFTFSGYVAANDLPARMAGADIFAAPSPVEGGPGFVYLEAMAAGLPVVACSGTGAAEVVRHGETGLLVPPRDAAALADALVRLLENRALCQRMGRAARSHVEAIADTRICVPAIADFYSDVLGRAAC